MRPLILVYYFRYYSTQELIDMVENEDFWEADVFITPPNDGLDSKEDSDDEEAPTKNIYLYRGTYNYMRDKLQKSQ